MGCPLPPLRSASAQSTIEMTLLLLAVVGTLVIMCTFLRGAVASRIKSGADTFGKGLRCNNLRVECQ